MCLFEWISIICSKFGHPGGVCAQENYLQITEKAILAILAWTLSWYDDENPLIQYPAHRLSCTEIKISIVRGQQVIASANKRNDFIWQQFKEL